MTKSKVMTNKVKNELETLVKKYGIESVMNTLVSSNKDKVFIPNWYYQEHIKSVIGKNIKLSKLNAKWIDEGGYDYISENIGEIYEGISF
jgi:hypothetical protein